MRTHRSIAFLVTVLLLVALTAGVAAAETGGGDLIGTLEQLAGLLRDVLGALPSADSAG